MSFFLFIDGEGFSPSMKKPKVNSREEDASVPLSPKATGRRDLGEARPIIDPSTMEFFASLREQKSSLSSAKG